MKIKGENGGGEIKGNDGESKDESENREMSGKKKEIRPSVVVPLIFC
jgi:hypothetical protein